MASAQNNTAVSGTTGAAANGTDGTDGTSSTSPCINSEDGSIELVCTVVVGVGIVVALITVCCIFHIIKLCVKLKNDPHLEESLRMYRLQPGASTTGSGASNSPPKKSKNAQKKTQPNEQQQPLPKIVVTEL